MECCQCGKKHKNKLDPDFCKACYDETERMMDRDVMMSRSAAARAYLNGQPDTLDSRRMQVYAFLSIIEPKMPEKRRLEIIQAVEAPAYKRY